MQGLFISVAARLRNCLFNFTKADVDHNIRPTGYYRAVWMC